MKKTRILELLAEAGISGDAIARAKEVLIKRPPGRTVDASERCISCGAKKLLTLDYLCGACSMKKADHPMLFWSWVSERADGGDGRPKQIKPRPQELPPQTERERFVNLRDVSDAKDPEPLPRFTFLVRLGCVGRVVVANFGFEAVRTVKAIHGLEESATNAVICLGRTDDDFTDVGAEKKEWEVA